MFFVAFTSLVFAIIATGIGLGYAYIHLSRQRRIRIAGDMHSVRLAYSKSREKELKKQAKELENGILEVTHWLTVQGKAQCNDINVRKWFKDRGYEVVFENGFNYVKLPPLSNKECSDLILGNMEKK